MGRGVMNRGDKIQHKRVGRQKMRDRRCGKG